MQSFTSMLKCACMYASVTAFHFLSADLQQVYALSKMTYRLSVFHKSFSWKWSSLFFCLLIWWRCWNGCTPSFSRMINPQLDEKPRVQRFPLQKISFSPQITTGKLKSPLPQNTLGLDSRRPCSRLLRSCWICRLLFELFAKVFLRPKCVCQAQHMIIFHQWHYYSGPSGWALEERFGGFILLLFTSNLLKLRHSFIMPRKSSNLVSCAHLYGLSVCKPHETWKERVWPDVVWAQTV